MANNNHVNKVIFDGRTLIDISDTTIDPSMIPMGSIAYAASGERITGSAIIYDVKYDTTENWNRQTTYVPTENDIIVYTDRSTTESGGVQRNVPGIKIGDGNAYVVDLPFTDDALSEALLNHVGDSTVHVTTAEKLFWNNKLNLEINGEQLLFNRL